MKVAIVGSGPAGLITAHFLKAQNQDVEITLIEKSERLGGNLQYLPRSNGHTLDCGIKYLPLYDLSSGVADPMNDFVESYGCRLVEVGEVYSVRNRRVVEGVDLGMPQLKVLSQVCRAFDLLYEASCCTDVLEVCDRLLVKETETLDAFGVRKQVPLVCRLLAMHADMFGFAINKQSSTAAYALLTRSHYSSALLYRILNRHPLIKWALQVAVEVGLVTVKFRKEFLGFLNQPKRYGTYRSVEEGTGCLFERIRTKIIDHLLSDSEVSSVDPDSGNVTVCRREGQAVMNFDRVFLATPFPALVTMLGLKNQRQNPCFGLRMVSHHVGVNEMRNRFPERYQVRDLVGLFDRTCHLGTSSLDTENDKILGCWEEDGSVQSFSYGSSDDVAFRHKNQLKPYFAADRCRGVFKFQSPPLPHVDAIEQGLLRDLKAFNRSDSKVWVMSQALFGASLFTLFNGVRNLRLLDCARTVCANQ